MIFISGNIDTTDIDDFAKTLLKFASTEMQKESKKFLQKEGNTLRKRTLAKAKSITNKKTGNYYAGIKRGKVYHYRDKNNNSVRVYGGSPHAHLIEYGHRHVSKNGKESGFVYGLYVFQKAKNEFERDFKTACEGFADDILKGLSK